MIDIDTPSLFAGAGDAEDPDNPLACSPGETLWIRCDGVTLVGSWVGARDGWLHLDATSGALVVHQSHIAAMGIGAPPSADNNQQIGAEKAPSKKKKSQSSAASATTPKEKILPAPDPEMIRRVVSGFLDDQNDTQLAQRFGMPKRSVQALRAAFECGRGNVVEDQLGALAAAWLEPLRTALSE